MPDSLTLAGLLLLFVHGAGFLSTIHVLMTGRTPQGVLAWIFFLILLPYIAVPLYWVFGPRHYDGYINARLTSPSPFDPVVDEVSARVDPFIAGGAHENQTIVSLERLVRMPMTGRNHVDLLIDGEATFSALFEAIDAATSFVLVQYFIVHDDEIGRELRDHLIECLERGVRVYFLFDEVGSRKLPKSYVRSLRNRGARVHAFSTTRRSNRFQINFRNHRKMVVVDGRVGFTGGLNCGDEYMGRDPNMSPWRDTFVRLRGPVVQGLQLSFLEDWHWATDEIPDWEWPLQPADDGPGWHALVLPTGPADAMESGSLVFVALLHAAKERLWISTPYFVFDNQILAALQLAALRGVDVQILVPERADYATAYYAGASFHEEVLLSGCRIFRYQDGFLHQKAILVDDHLALLGTMNLDNRSMRLNFEISVLVDNQGFAAQVEAMLATDFAAAKEVTRARLAEKGAWFRLKSRAARLFAPVL